MTKSNVQLPVSTTRFGVVGMAIGKVQFRIRKLLQQHRYDKLAIEWVDGAPILVMPGVFNPRALRTGVFFARSIGAVISRETSMLDMGTGSGICAVFAAKQARRVVAVDINRAAVRCARINALMNHVDDKVDVRHGDLFAPLDGERFDLVLFNPPFLKGEPKNERDCAWRSSDAIERFAAGLKGHLQPDGFALVLLSTFGNSTSFIDEFRRRGFSAAVHAEHDFINEKLTIFKITHD